MNKKKSNISENGKGYHPFLIFLERYWKLLSLLSAVILIVFNVGVWVGERNNIDEVNKLRNEQTRELLKYSMELANQERRPIVINLIDSIKDGREDK